MCFHRGIDECFHYGVVMVTREPALNSRRDTIFFHVRQCSVHCIVVIFNIGLRHIRVLRLTRACPYWRH